MNSKSSFTGFLGSVLNLGKKKKQQTVQVIEKEEDKNKEDEDEMNLGATGGTLIKKEENQVT